MYKMYNEKYNQAAYKYIKNYDYFPIIYLMKHGL